MKSNSNNINKPIKSNSKLEKLGYSILYLSVIAYIILAFFALTSCSSDNDDGGSDPITIAIPDANFEQALIDLGHDTNGLNGNILQSDAEAVTSFDVSGNSISSLEGIHGFTNLSVLIADLNNITTIDVSANINLTGLFLASNDITTIDVSANVNLMGLSLSINPLSSIDVSVNQNLLQLTVRNTGLTNIDVSNNSSLEALDCESNQLTSLNVKNGNNTNFTNFNATDNPSLDCIEVDNVTFSNSNWSSGIDGLTAFAEDCN